MNFVTITTHIRCIKTCSRTTSNTDPIKTRQIFALSILVTNRRNSCASSVCIVYNVSRSKCNAVLIENNIQFTLNTRSSNICSVNALGYNLTITDDTCNTTTREINFKFLVSGVPCKNVYVLWRTSNCDSCCLTRCEVTNNILQS